ncbi:hypothetical protein FGB62_115g00 [Gracilaria domingensis]|nr:hypothetical protein FGB62_438g01 [Gracilaria domingensis]KAI0560366.1 hypothetical protein FGB62_115g00 [Gracilaria domingensis]
MGSTRKVRKHNRGRFTSKTNAAVEPVREHQRIERRLHSNESPMVGKKHKKICRQPSADLSEESSSESDVDYGDEVPTSHNSNEADDSAPEHPSAEGFEDVVDNSQDIEISETESEIERMRRRRRRAVARMAKGRNAKRESGKKTSSKLSVSELRPNVSIRTRQPRSRRTT